MPADHEAQSQVQQDSCNKVKALEESLTRKTVRRAKFTTVGGARVHARERESSEHVQGSGVRQ